MKTKRFFAALLTVCLLVTLMAPSATAVGTKVRASYGSRENILFELLDKNLFDLDLFSDDLSADLKVEKIEDDQLVKILIIMDDLSVIETDSKAAYSEQTQAMMDDLTAGQAEVIAAIEQLVLEGQSLDISYSYTWLLNGVAAQVPYGLISQIKKIDGVKQVLLQPQYEVCTTQLSQSGSAELMTNASGSMIGRDETWACGYTGKGIKIAIIDTGLDDDHQNFQALPEEKLTETSADFDTVDAVLDQLNATARFNEQATKNHTEMITTDDLYRSTKVVFAFNYADNNLDVTHDNDTMGDHGTHVSGIAAANKVEDSDVVGVAPDAQLYVMKVYGADHGGYAEDILAALEDALLLGADVINMSLGTNAGFTTGAEEVNAIYNRVAETNTVLSVAAGNNYTSGYGNTWGNDKNQTMYPDNAVISQPGVYNNVLSVASVENSFIMRRYIAAGDRKLAFVETSASYELPSIDTLEESYGLVLIPGMGAEKDFEGLDLTGKIALVKRGVKTFAEKCENAAAAGAVACIVYNNTTAEFGMDLTDCTAGIPCISIMEEDGEYLISLLEEDPDMTISFPKDLTSLPSQFVGQISDFSSWGVAPDLSLEPDITAPGGNIYSTINDGEYGLMSGTSMAAPHMSGMIALTMQYVRENYPETEIPVRELVQNLLVSTSLPQAYGTEGLYYSPRQQGSGVGDVFQAISTAAYLTVEGVDTPKAELGDDDKKTGSYEFTYQVHNFGDKTLYYYLDTMAQTEDYTTSEDHPDLYFMAGTPKALGAETAESSENLILTHDLGGNGTADSRDAYLIWQQAQLDALADTTTTAGDELFRYDTNKDEAVTVDDVQAYLNALVGLESEVDLEEQVLQVEAGQTAEVTVSIRLADADRQYFRSYYPNGCYVEGYTFLNAINGTDLSLPYLGFYGDWDAAPVLDSGFYWELLDEEAVADQEEEEGTEDTTEPSDPADPTDPSEPSQPADPTEPTEPTEPANPTEPTKPENPDDGEDDEDGEDGEDFNDDELEEDSKDDVIVGNQYAHVLFTEFYGMSSTFYPGFNAYVSEEFDVGHISISPNGDGYIDTIDDIYVSLLRNARYLTFRYVDADTGEVYYEQTAEFASKSFYTAAYGQILPTIYSWLQDDIMLYNFTGSDGEVLPNNTHLLLQVEAVGDYEGATTDSWEIPVTIDLEAPELLSVVKTIDEEGKVWLELTFRDNLSVSAVALMNSNGQDTYYLDGTVDEEPDENGYRNYTVTYDITDISGKLLIVLADYALNETYYGLNTAGEGTAYGDLVGYQYNFDTENTGWVAFGENVNKDEIQITMDEMDYESAEYVGGYVFAQTDSGALYGFRYTDLLADRVDVDATFVAQLERTYQDLAYNYVTGELYGLNAYYDGDGYPTTEIYTINIRGEYVDESTGQTVPAYAETWTQSRGGLYGISMTVDDEGTIYLLGVNKREKTELWRSSGSGDGMVFKKVMSLDVQMDYAQSMTFDHNSKTLYWAQFYPTSIDTFLTELYVIDVSAKTYTSVGTLSGETCGLFAPLSPETVASNPIYQNIPAMDADAVGRPILRKEVVNMNVGAEETLYFDFDPWYTNHKDVIWSSSDESVVSVDEKGHIVALSKGTAVITVTAADDATRFDSCTVTVTELSLSIEGILSNQGSGVGNTSGSKLYKFELDKSVPSCTEGNLIYAPESLDFGLEIATSVYARGYIWACEYGNTGMVYKIDPATGEVLEALMPIDGDMLFGMTYSEELDTFTAIMNMHLFVDLELTEEEQKIMVDSYDADEGAFMYHRINLLEYLLAAGGNFVTGEYGQGASSEIVMCGITNMGGGYVYVDTAVDYLGRATDGMDSVNYTASQTLVILDNVGRLWYIDEICGMTKTTSSWQTKYTSEDGSEISFYNGYERDGIIELDNGDGTYNIFYIRTIEETPLTDMYRNDRMPRITYHFSDIEFGGHTEDGAPIFVMSLYDYWNNGTTNELYLYIPEYTGADGQVSPEKLYYLGNTGQYNIVASIHHFELIGGLDD